MNDPSRDYLAGNDTLVLAVAAYGLLTAGISLVQSSSALPVVVGAALFGLVPRELDENGWTNGADCDKLIGWNWMEEWRHPWTSPRSASRPTSSH